jgi:hypothetical protein
MSPQPTVNESELNPQIQERLASGIDEVISREETLKGKLLRVNRPAS